MGKRSSGGPKPPKRKRVTVKPIQKMKDGKPTEPYAIMGELIRTTHGLLADARIALAWRDGWKADADGRLILGRMKKGSDLDLAFWGFDFVMLLNHEAWPVLPLTKKKMVIDHELCHAAPVMDTGGNQKQDDAGRLVWRIRKHDVEQFVDVIKRYGKEAMQLDRDALAAINDAKRPLLAEAEKAGTENETAETDRDGWKRLKLSAAGIDGQIGKALEETGIKTLGKLSTHMEKKASWWARPIKGLGEAGREKVENLFANFWQTHPEYTQADGKKAVAEEAGAK